MRNYTTHPFHLVDVSPWPILKSFGLLSGALALVSWLTLGQNSTLLYVVVFTNIVFIFYQWLKDIVREGLAGYHTQAVREGLKLGFIIFLITEVLLFASFFWAFFHSSLNPSVELAVWPPLGVNAIDCWSLPLLNSILLSVALARVYTDQLTTEHCLGLDVSIIYFHFTDIVWLGLYLVVYYWGG